MPGGNGRDDHEDRPETAVEEVLREVEEAGKREDKRDEDDRGRKSSGEAGDAITPNTGAQEQAEGDG
ncbi:hypothetical protein [Streptomyces sp. NPDC051132]|uniref:hypothetical protein n=1 Tax=unclassified Streptomyces TaxID=2593676 RepID=UPI003436FDC8